MGIFLACFFLLTSKAAKDSVETICCLTCMLYVQNLCDQEKAGCTASPTPGNSYVAVTCMSLVRSKETRDQQSQHSEVHFLLLQMSTTGSSNIKELSSIPTFLHNPLEIPLMKCVISAKPMRSCGWGKLSLSNLQSPVLLAADLILLKSWVWWRLKSLCY